MYYPTCAGGRDLSNNTRISSIQSRRWEKKTKNYVTLNLKFVWKSCSTTRPPFSSKPFPKTFPIEMRRLLNAQQWIENRNMRREERKKRGGEKAKRKSQDCCDTFKPTRDLFTATFTKHSPHVRESKTVLDSGFHFTHSGFQVLNSSLFSVKSLSFIPDSESPDSRFHKHKFHGFRNLDFLNSQTNS